MIVEFYNYLLEAVRPSAIQFVKGKRDMSGNILRNNKELASLFSKELDKVGSNPDRLTKTNIDAIYKAANPGLQKHMDNMKSQRGDEWYKPKKGYGFTSNSQLKHAKHLVLAGDVRLIMTKLRDGKFDYSITNHGAKGPADYQHVLDYVKKVRGAAEQPKKKDVPQRPPASTSTTATQRMQARTDRITKKNDELKRKIAARKDARNNPSQPKQGRSMATTKKPSLFDRLKSVVGRR